jgi:hypothetical protein
MYVNVSEFKLSDWRNRQTTNLVLRIIANSTFIADDGEDGDLIQADTAYGQVPVTVANEAVNGYTSPTLTIPALQIHSTTDAIVNRNATYRAEIWSTKLNKKLKTLDFLQSFRVVFVDYETNWTAIIQYNTMLPISSTMTLDDEIKNLINSMFAGLNFNLGSGTPDTISKFKSSGVGLEDSDYFDTGSALAPTTSGKNLGTVLLPFSTGNINTWNGEKYQVLNGTRALSSTVNGDSNAQYARLTEGVLGIAVQTIHRESLLQTGTGGGVSSNLAFYSIPTDHPSDYPGEKYTFKVAGDVTGTTSSKTIECRTSEGTVICSLAISSGLNVKWEAEISVSMMNLTGTPDTIIQARIHTSNNLSTFGIKKVASITSLDGFTFFLAATDSGTSETRALFSEVMHEDWNNS